jgi:hypothetical protein
MFADRAITVGNQGQIMNAGMLKIAAAAILGCSVTANAECVLGAQEATTFRVLDTHTIVLSGGPSGAILIKSFAFFNSSSNVSVLKDDFCDFDSNVLYVDGEAVDVQQVKAIR